MHEVLRNIRESFIKEALSSPMLLYDLANMEVYIAESYYNRSFIELLQNADDALSRRFYVSSMSNILIVANDGRTFNEQDFYSICRSGVSTKKRGGKTIGYRGIGFK